MIYTIAYIVAECIFYKEDGKSFGFDVGRGVQRNFFWGGDERTNLSPKGRLYAPRPEGPRLRGWGPGEGASPSPG